VGKTIIIAEKPSVGRDISVALPGKFAKHEGYLESDDHVVTWAVGHLVTLAEPEDYDERFKRWRMDDLPIVPERFKLKPRDERSKKQLEVIHKLLARDDVDRVINACDSGREGELIFAYVWETAKVDKPIERLWISSMTKQAIQEGFERLRPKEQMEPLERAARSRSEADWLVGMNATRAATLRGRAWVGGVVSLGRVQTPTLALIVRRERQIQAFVPVPYWLVHGTFEAPSRAGYTGLWFSESLGDTDRDQSRIPEELRAHGIAERVGGNDGTVKDVVRKEQTERAPLRPHEPAARRELPFRVRGEPDAARGAIALRGQEGDYLSADVVPLSLRGPRSDLEAGGRDARADPSVRAVRAFRARSLGASARPSRQRCARRRPSRDDPHRDRA
jgi:DNA topoisomerase-3